MTAQAHSLFGDAAAPPRPARAPRVEVPISTPETMALKREIIVLFTCAADTRTEWLAKDGVTPTTALARVIEELKREPHEVSVEARPETPNDVEIRDESKPDQPRHMLALVFQGLNIADARAALAELRNPPTPSSSKGGRR